MKTETDEPNLSLCIDSLVWSWTEVVERAFREGFEAARSGEYDATEAWKQSAVKENFDHARSLVVKPIPLEGAHESA